MRDRTSSTAGASPIRVWSEIWVRHAWPVIPDQVKEIPDTKRLLLWIPAYAGMTRDVLAWRSPEFVEINGFIARNCSEIIISRLWGR